ncbi:MAG: TonB-dependent receptor [Spirochaetales bacterium]|nr:TonB-dependent receptor [Leptospiraceae bacterium]MCP5482768.1 TonB-dependent receptor [Spirochaetales bacterium]
MSAVYSRWFFAGLITLVWAPAVLAQDERSSTRILLGRFESLGTSEPAIEQSIGLSVREQLQSAGLDVQERPENATELRELRTTLDGDLIVGGYYSRGARNQLSIYAQLYRISDGALVDAVSEQSLVDRVREVDEESSRADELLRSDEQAVAEFSQRLVHRLRSNPRFAVRSENLNESIYANPELAGRLGPEIESSSAAVSSVFAYLEDQEVVTASRASTSLREAPAAVYVITERMIRERGYRTLVDALHDVPGFDIIHTSGIFPDLIHQRGLVGNNQRTLLYVNGVLDNNLTESAILAGSLRFPLHNVERIEVVAGPSSAVYGANAFNGVINIITRDGSDGDVYQFEGTAGWWESNFRNPAGSGSITARGIAGLADEPVLYSVSAYYLKSQGPYFGDRRRLDAKSYDNNDVSYHVEQELCGGQCEPGPTAVGYYWSPLYNVSDEDHYNVMATFHYQGLRFQTLNWQYLQGQGTFSNATNTIDTRQQGYQGSNWDFRNNSVLLGYTHDWGERLSLDSELVVRHTEILSSSHEQVPNETTPNFFYRPDDHTTVSDYARPDYSYEAEERLQWRPTDGLTTTLGGSASYTVVPQGYGQQERYRYRNFGAYLEQFWRPWRALALTGGYRFDRNTIYGVSHTPRLGAVVSPLRDLTLKLLLSTGFRAPTAWETLNATLQRQANPELKPERMQTVEAGVGYRFLRRYYVSVHGYQTRVKDLLLEVETNQPNPDVPGENYTQNQNVGTARIRGVESEFDLSILDSFHVFLNYTYNEGEYRDLPATVTASPSTTGRTGDDYGRDLIEASTGRTLIPDEGPIPNIARHRLNAGFTWYLFRNFSLHARANYADVRRTIASNPVRTTPGYTLFHINLRWEDAFTPGLYMDLSVRNAGDDPAFDPGIRTATGGYYPTMHPIEGRNIWFTLGYRF